MEWSSGIATRSTDGSAMSAILKLALYLTLSLAAGCSGDAPDSPDGIKLSWIDGAHDEDGFTVERSSGPGQPFVEIMSLSPDTTLFRDTDSVLGTTYCYRVRAFNAAGTSEYSNEVCGDEQTPLHTSERR